MPVIEKISSHKMRITPTDLEVQTYLDKNQKFYILALLLNMSVKDLVRAEMTYYQVSGQ